MRSSTREIRIRIGEKCRAETAMIANRSVELETVANGVC